LSSVAFAGRWVTVFSQRLPRSSSLAREVNDVR
jgi:hypothetical protein